MVTLLLLFLQSNFNRVACIINIMHRKKKVRKKKEEIGMRRSRKV